MLLAAEDAAKVGRITPEMVEGELLSRDFRSYIREAWPIIESQPFISGWHIDAIADHLEALKLGSAGGGFDSLLINVSPGCSKSTLVSVLFPTWLWGPDPANRSFHASYDLALSLRDAMKARLIIRSEWFRARWPMLQIREDQDAKGRYETTAGGFRMSTSIGGHGLGEHPHLIAVDDPHNREKISSDVERQSVLDWWDLTISTRGAAIGVRRAVIMQRLHQRDLAGHILETDPSFVHLVLPMRYEPKRMVTTPIGWNDPRQYKGELMDPKRFPEEVVQKIERQLGSIGAAGQLQQRPAPVGGGVIKTDRIKFWQPKDANLGPVTDSEGTSYPVIDLPERMDQEVLSADCSFKDELGQVRKGLPPDPVALGIIGRRRAMLFLLDGWSDRADITRTEKELLKLGAAWPLARVKLIEDKANGAAIMSRFRRAGIAGITPVTPHGSKVARVVEAGADQKSKDAKAMSMAAVIEAGDFVLPHPGMSGYGWVFDCLKQLGAFPNASNDDWVDMLSQAFMYFERFIDRDAKAEADKMAEEPFPKNVEELVRREQWKRLEEEDRERAGEDYSTPGDVWLR